MLILESCPAIREPYKLTLFYCLCFFFDIESAYYNQDFYNSLESVNLIFNIQTETTETIIYYPATIRSE
ncbi:MAG: hypothetical protein EAX86_08590 [Candidatus Heimdallarchaeota archaeon]|nr:hypothetical protein [Candidatus Heimdallarchaeota archaeon]